MGKLNTTEYNNIRFTIYQNWKGMELGMPSVVLNDSLQISSSEAKFVA